MRCGWRCFSYGYPGSLHDQSIKSLSTHPNSLDPGCVMRYKYGKFTVRDKRSQFGAGARVSAPPVVG